MENKKWLINANTLIEDHCKVCKYFKVNGICTKENPICGIVALIKEQPTVDAVEVVRCINCRYYNTEQSECNIKFDSDGEKLLMPPDAYCSDGKRRKNDG